MGAGRRSVKIHFDCPRSSGTLVRGKNPSVIRLRLKVIRAIFIHVLILRDIVSATEYIHVSAFRQTTSKPSPLVRAASRS